MQEYRDTKIDGLNEDKEKHSTIEEPTSSDVSQQFIGEEAALIHREDEAKEKPKKEVG